MFSLTDMDMEKVAMICERVAMMCERVAMMCILITSSLITIDYLAHLHTNYP